MTTTINQQLSTIKSLFSFQKNHASFAKKQFENCAKSELTKTAQNMLKGGGDGDDDDIIIEDTIGG